MTTTKLKSVLCITTMLSLVPTFAALAADDAMGEIIVTARRVEERLQDVPISITVFTPQELADRNIVTAGDLGYYAPSLTVNNRFGPDKASFTIRGFSQEGVTSPTVGVYFADVVQPRVASGTSGGNGSGVGAFFDLQNVQVLKGPQGTLFGRNTTGGAILLVPQKPTDEYGGYVEGSIGNFNMWRGQAAVNVPVSDKLRFRVGVDRQQRDGHLRNRSGVGPGDFGNVNYLALRASVVVDLTPDLENYTIASYSDSDTNGTHLRLIGCQRNAALRTGSAAFLAPSACDQIDRQTARGDSFYDVEGAAPNPYNKTEQWQVINTTTWTASDTLTVKNIFSYAEYREKLNMSIGGDNFFGTSGTSLGLRYDYIKIYNAPNAYSNIQSTFTEELQFQGQLAGGRLKWQAGGYYESAKPKGAGNTTYSQVALTCTDPYAFRCTSFFGATGGLGLVFTKVTYRNIGLYGQATYDLTDRFAITAGLRETWDRTTGQAGRVTVNFPTPNTPTTRCANGLITIPPGSFDPLDCDQTITQKSSRPTWTIDLAYRPLQDTMLYAKYSRGYRQGGVDAGVIGLESWNPEKVDTYEIGVKAVLTGTVRGYFNIAGFYNNFRDQQISAIALAKPGSGVSGARVVVNAGKSRITGVEVDSSISPIKGVKVDVGYAYLRTKLQAFVAPNVAAFSPYASVVSPAVGGDLTLSPHHRITMTGTYTLPLSESLGRLSAGLTYTYTTSQIGAPANPFGIIPPAELVNLNVNWESIGGSPADLSFFVTNLTKKEFPLNVANNWSSAGYEGAVTNLPQMWGMRARYRF